MGRTGTATPRCPHLWVVWCQWTSRILTVGLPLTTDLHVRVTAIGLRVGIVCHFVMLAVSLIYSKFSPMAHSVVA